MACSLPGKAGSCICRVGRAGGRGDGKRYVSCGTNAATGNGVYSGCRHTRCRQHLAIGIPSCRGEMKR
ncbi:hypothetical protein ASZ90_010275 [hydrocarbon metagenome]|uniref:Uncharacterized protein n=1 Tax=hydrocarbon metagenome TaxID=938273 RepID=A0A0W8FGL3_9ZZZZ